MEILACLLEHVSKFNTVYPYLVRPYLSSFLSSVNYTFLEDVFGHCLLITKFL